MSLGWSDGFLRVLTVDFDSVSEQLSFKVKSEIEINTGDIALHHDSSNENYSTAMDSGDLYVFDKSTNEVIFRQEKAHLYQMWYSMIDKTNTNII